MQRRTENVCRGNKYF